MLVPWGRGGGGLGLGACMLTLNKTSTINFSWGGGATHITLPPPLLWISLCRECMMIGNENRKILTTLDYHPKQWPGCVSDYTIYLILIHFSCVLNFAKMTEPYFFARIIFSISRKNRFKWYLRKCVMTISKSVIDS